MFGEKKDEWVCKQIGNLGLRRAEIQPPAETWVIQHWVPWWGVAQPKQLYHFINPHLHRAVWGQRGGCWLPVSSVSWLWVRALLSVCQALRSKRWSSQGLQSVLRTWFQRPANWSQRPSPARLTPRYLLTFASLVWFSLESPPLGEAWGMNAPAWADLKGRAMTDLSPVSSFSSSLPKSTRLLAWSPSWPHDSRYRRRPLLQDLPKHPQKHQQGPKGRNAPLYLCTTPPLPSNQCSALTS